MSVQLKSYTIINPPIKIKYYYELKYQVNIFNVMYLEKEKQEEEEFGPNGSESDGSEAVEGEDG